MVRHPASMLRRQPQPRLRGARVILRPIVAADFPMWRDVRLHNESWLIPWEPQRHPSLPDPTRDRHAFEARCAARERERNTDHAYPFGVFVNDELAGEVNINNVTRGALQSATIGYWIDQRLAGNGYIAEAVVVAMRFAFEQVQLHRLEICIVPRNARSRRVMEKLDVREEGIAMRYLEIAGTWEDHIRYGITIEEWIERQATLGTTWLSNT